MQVSWLCKMKCMRLTKLARASKSALQKKTRTASTIKTHWLYPYLRMHQARCQHRVQLQQMLTRHKVRAQIGFCAPPITQAADVAQALQAHMPHIPCSVDLWVQRQLQIPLAWLCSACITLTPLDISWRNN